MATQKYYCVAIWPPKSVQLSRPLLSLLYSLSNIRIRADRALFAPPTCATNGKKNGEVFTCTLQCLDSSNRRFRPRQNSPVSLHARISGASATVFFPRRSIDYYPRDVPQNFLFRGNMPTINGSFAYDAIVSTMSTVARQNNLTFPDNFSLIDVR